MVFQPGFSTAAKVTNVSGRGVGMDVVKTNIERIGGAVSVDSTPGEGTVWRLTIPLTLAIIQALTVDCGDQRYVVPQVAVLELVFIDGQATKIEYASGAPVYRLRGKLLPLVRLDRALGLDVGGDQGVYIMVLQADGRRFGLVVDRVLNTEEVVVKALNSQVQGHRPVRRRDHPGRRQGRPDPGRLLAGPAQPPGRRLRTGEPGRRLAGRGRHRHRRTAAGHRGRRAPGGDPAGHGHPARGVPARPDRARRLPRGRAVPRPDPAAGAAVAPARRVRRGAGGRHRLGGRLQRGRPQRRAGRRPDRRHRRELHAPPAGTPRRTAWSAPRSSSSG